MNNDEFIKKIMGIVGEERAAAYKQGFSDGITFIKQSTHITKPAKIEDFWEDEDL